MSSGIIVGPCGTSFRLAGIVPRPYSISIRAFDVPCPLPPYGEATVPVAWCPGTATSLLRKIGRIPGSSPTLWPQWSANSTSDVTVSVQCSTETTYWRSSQSFTSQCFTSQELHLAYSTRGVILRYSKGDGIAQRFLDLIRSRVVRSFK
nr:hypothetical protein CFP56_30784 [Quercus suber]